MNVSSAPVYDGAAAVPRMGSGTPATATPVTVSPSRRELRRADPSLSFQIAAPGFHYFDVIVATDPTLFDPAQAHRRTPKNFRSSRQDFQGQPIEIETGFYMLPRAFIRDAISIQPRPTRLHYLAVAYPDAAANDGLYSIAPERFAAAPYVSLGSDLSAASLSHILGMAVGRLGSVNAAGRVVSAAASASPEQLPRMIGGLPVGPSTPAATPRPAARPAPAPVARPAPAAGPSPARAERPAPAANGSNGSRSVRSGGVPSPVPANGKPAAATPPPARQAPPVQTAPSDPGFVDDDYAYGQDTDELPGFRDVDAMAGGAARQWAPDYDDGLGPLSLEAPATEAEPPQPAPPAETAEPIPPLDPPPPAPSNGGPASNGGNGAGAARIAAGPPPQSPGAQMPEGGAWKDALVAAVIADGIAGRYEALNLDGAFRGRMGLDHPYYQRAHDGLSIGPHQANQDTGELGELLEFMRTADPATFAATFGPAADQLVEATTQAGPMSGESESGRGARVQPVEGHDLWDDAWVERFRKAARHPPFQAAIRAQIVARRLEPMLPVAEALNMATPRGHAMLLTLAILAGAQAAITAARAAVNPFDTPARLAGAIEALGHDGVEAFRTASGLPPGGSVDDATHFALLAALRGLGAEAPVQVPDGEAAMDMLVTALGPGAAGDALLKLRVSGSFRPTGEAG